MPNEIHLCIELGFNLWDCMFEHTRELCAHYVNSMPVHFNKMQLTKTLM